MAKAREFSTLDIYLASFFLLHGIGPKLEHGEANVPVVLVVCSNCGAICTPCFGPSANEEGGQR